MTAIGSLRRPPGAEPRSRIDQKERPATHSILVSLLLHLVPGVVTVAVYLALLPVVAAWPLPSRGPGRGGAARHGAPASRRPLVGRTSLAPGPGRDAPPGAPKAGGGWLGPPAGRPGSRGLRRPLPGDPPPGAVSLRGVAPGVEATPRHGPRLQPGRAARNSPPRARRQRPRRPCGRGALLPRFPATTDATSARKGRAADAHRAVRALSPLDAMAHSNPDATASSRSSRRVACSPRKGGSSAGISSVATTSPRRNSAYVSRPLVR
jgi:hypothetical protein